MRQIVMLFLVSLIVSVAPVHAQPDDEAPYIYYYSEALNGIVIERADGSDSRVIGQGLVEEDVLFTYGPGWSPDGRWFAWRVTESNYLKYVGKGYVVNVSDTDTLSMLEDFACVHEMQWHPTENILLVRGTILPQENGCPQDAYPVATYWLIDVDAQRLLATFSINALAEGYTHYWFPAERQIRMSQEVRVADDEFDTHYYLITMTFDGAVTMEPVSRDTVYARLQGGILQGGRYGDSDETDFTTYAEASYPVGEDGDTLDFPPNSSSATPSIVSWQWDQSDEWLLVGYEFCYSACSGVTGRVTIFNPTTGYNREISECGGHPTCVGWLPDKVNTHDLPPGKPTTVLPAPDSMDADNGFLKTEGHYGSFHNVITHQLVCNEDEWLLNRVEDLNTGALDFVLPGQPSCDNYIRFEETYYFETIQIIFALSPDERYYAITDSSEYTSLYDAQTGENIATLNIYGIKLAFSEDSRYLITTGRYLQATWDIAELESRTGEPQS